MTASLLGYPNADTHEDHVEAWFDGKENPNLALLRFDAASAEIWLNETSLLSGVKLLPGADPKREFADNVAKVKM